MASCGGIEGIWEQKKLTPWCAVRDWVPPEAWGLFLSKSYVIS